jgi:predicted ABC-type ATPase
MPRITIIGGPNGAGKTLFARELLSISRDDYYVNADVIARSLVAEGLPASKTDARAAREMLNRIDELIAAGNDFMLESTLASRSYAQRIPAWRAIGYHVALIYVRLPSAEHSLERVQKRVTAGGHSIPEDVIRRRFTKSLQYLEALYKPIVDEWAIWDSLEGEFRRAKGSDD